MEILTLKIIRLNRLTLKTFHEVPASFR